MKRALWLAASILVLAFGLVTLSRAPWRRSAAAPGAPKADSSALAKARVRQFWDIYRRAGDLRMAGKWAEAREAYRQAPDARSPTRRCPLLPRKRGTGTGQLPGCRRRLGALGRGEPGQCPRPLSPGRPARLRRAWRPSRLEPSTAPATAPSTICRPFAALVRALAQVDSAKVRTRLSPIYQQLDLRLAQLALPAHR